MNDLEGRVIAIAGAAGGLGPTVATRLASAGASIAATDISEERLAALGDELGIGEERYDGRVVDLLDPDAALQWATSLEERFGRVDGVLHLVGGWRGGQPLPEAPLSDYEWLHDLLVRTAINTSRAFHDRLVASGHGRFVLVSSSAAQRPEGANAAYAATKSAAEAWTMALANSFAGSGATANIVVVNAIVTPQMRAANPDKAYATFTDAGDIAEAIAFLLSDSAAKMNGKRLPLYP